VEEHLRHEEDRVKRLRERGSGLENVYQLRREMEQVLSNNVGIFRSEAPLKEAVARLHELHERAQHIGLRGGGKGADPEVGAALRLPGMIRLAYCIAQGALARQESRGSHYREDFPKRDDVNWLVRTLAYWPTGGSEPELHYEPVRITESPPGDRGYGEASRASAQVKS
jgi:fumarate reductase flavoprotein subunit